MTWILRVVRSRGLLVPFGVFCVFLVACSTDVDYLREGRTAGSAGAGGDNQPGAAGAGGRGGEAGSSAGVAGATNVPDADQDVDGRHTPKADASAEAGDGWTPPRPIGITFGDPESTSPLTQSDGGMAYADTCLPGQVVIGFNATVDGPQSLGTYPKSIQAICGALTIAGESPLVVKTTLTGPLPSRGDGSTVPVSRTCPPDRMVVGFDSRVGMFVDQLTFRCASLAISGGPEAYTLSIGQLTSIDPIGGAGGMLGPQINCAAGSVALGTVVRAGQAIDAFGLSCAKPALTFSQGDAESEGN